MVRELEQAKQQTGQVACDHSVWRLVRLRNIASEQTTARAIKIPSSDELTREMQKNQEIIMAQINGFGANAQEFEYPKLVANIRLKLVLSPDIDRHQPYHSQIQELQAQMNGLKAENLDVKTENLDLKTENFDLKTENFDLKTENLDVKTENFDLKTENFDLKTENSNLRRINQELQWRIDPNSPDGDAICNSDW
jgi:hypothetical protein